MTIRDEVGVIRKPDVIHEFLVIVVVFPKQKANVYLFFILA